MMTVDEFKQSLGNAEPPANIDEVARALWYGGRGDWGRAHRIVQEISGSNAAWVHAWLHRQEGDGWNADYWYQRAGRPRSELPLAQEWEEILSALLSAA